MVLADFKCSICGEVQERDANRLHAMDDPVAEFCQRDSWPYTETKHEDGSMTSELRPMFHQWVRQYTPVAIGQVPGAGGSPSR